MSHYQILEEFLAMDIHLLQWHKDPIGSYLYNWKRIAMNCQTLNTFEGISSDHWIVSSIMRISLRANKTKQSAFLLYGWSLLPINSYLKNQYTIVVRNKFETLHTEEPSHNTI